MKRKYIPLLSTIIALVITLSGCSCTSATPLNFSDNFNAGIKPSVNYTETVSYKVKNIDSYSDKFHKSSIISKDVLEYEMNGSFVMTLKVLDRTDEKVKALDSDILDSQSNTDTSVVYHLKTELNLTTSYKAPYEIQILLEDKVIYETNKSFNETITTETYFLPSGYSFNPIYSETNGKTSFVQIDDNSKATIIFLDYNTKALYNKNNYTTRTKYGSVNEITAERNYTFKTLIDNNSLLFALRNVSLELNDIYVAPVVHPTYSNAESLKITNIEERSENIKLNGATINIPVKEYSFARNAKNETGSAQYVLIQKEKASEIPNKSLIVEYTAPLSCYGSYICLGGLQYTLESYSFS